MKKILTLRQIRYIQQTLFYSENFSPDGKRLPRVFSGEELSAYRWFLNNTEELFKKYQDKINKKIEELTKKYKKDENRKIKIEQELNEDEELNWMNEEEHDVELSEKTISLIKKIYKEAKFSADEWKNAEVYDMVQLWK